jgi:hypothetical protein
MQAVDRDGDEVMEIERQQQNEALRPQEDILQAVISVEFNQKLPKIRAMRWMYTCAYGQPRFQQGNNSAAYVSTLLLLDDWGKTLPMWAIPRYVLLSDEIARRLAKSWSNNELGMRRILTVEAVLEFWSFDMTLDRSVNEERVCVKKAPSRLKIGKRATEGVPRQNGVV